MNMIYCKIFIAQLMLRHVATIFNPLTSRWTKIFTVFA